MSICGLGTLTSRVCNSVSIYLHVTVVCWRSAHLQVDGKHSNEAALILHRKGFDCCFSSRDTGLLCSTTQGKVRWKLIFACWVRVLWNPYFLQIILTMRCFIASSLTHSPQLQISSSFPILRKPFLNVQSLLLVTIKMHRQTCTRLKTVPSSILRPSISNLHSTFFLPTPPFPPLSDMLMYDPVQRWQTQVLQGPRQVLQ